MDRLPIDVTLEKVNKVYRSGTLRWMKKSRPEDWKRFIDLEDKINRYALEKNPEALKETLEEYRELITRMVRLFKTPEGKNLNLFQE